MTLFSSFDGFSFISWHCFASTVGYVYHLGLIYVTGPEKTGRIYAKYTCSCYGTYLAFWMCYSQSVSFIEFPIDFCMHDKTWGSAKTQNGTEQNQLGAR